MEAAPDFARWIVVVVVLLFAACQGCADSDDPADPMTDVADASEPADSAGPATEGGEDDSTTAPQNDGTDPPPEDTGEGGEGEDAASPEDSEAPEDSAGPEDTDDPEDGEAPEDIEEPEDTEVPVDAEMPSDVLSMTIGPFDVGAGVETTRCIQMRLDNLDPVAVTSISQILAPGSHHLIVYKTEETVEQPEPQPCSPFIGALDGTVPIFISQIKDEELVYPEGVGLILEPQQMIRLEAHYFNTTDTPIEGQSTVQFHTAPVDAIDEQIGFLFYGTTEIVLPPLTETSSVPSFKKPPKGAKIFGLTAHQHELGTNFTIERTKGQFGDGELIYENSDWDEPPVKVFDPPLELDHAAGEGLRWQCTWFNHKSSLVTFGLDATDEMCFLWGYYYPSQGTDIFF